MFKEVKNGFEEEYKFDNWVTNNLKNVDVMFKW